MPDEYINEQCIFPLPDSVWNQDAPMVTHFQNRQVGLFEYNGDCSILQPVAREMDLESDPWTQFRYMFVYLHLNHSITQNGTREMHALIRERE